MNFFARFVVVVGFNSVSCVFQTRESATRSLLDSILTGYNPINRPVQNVDDIITVKLQIKFSQLLQVHQKSQTMRTNVWLRQEWIDEKLVWNPTDYYDIEVVRVPASDIWLPDIVLYNNADGNYEIKIRTKAKVFYNGTVIWEPPAVFKSMCNIDVQWFPFDEQVCNMTFGSWTYDGSEVNLIFLNDSEVTRTARPGLEIETREMGMDLSDFVKSAEWDIMAIPAKRRSYIFDCCRTAPFVQITFELYLRRKTLFYTINLVVPSVGITFLAQLVFFLPSDSGEKVPLAISILISTTVYFLLLVEIIPNNSIAIPLIGQYLLFTMVMVILSIILTVMTLNVHYRTQTTHDMPLWVKRVFMVFLPKILRMSPPGGVQSKESTFPFKKSASNNAAEFRAMTLVQDFAHDASFGDNSMANSSGRPKLCCYGLPRVRAWITSLVECACFIASYLRRQTKQEEVAGDWHYVATVIDRLLLLIFSLASLFGTSVIFLQAPVVFDRRIPIA